MVRIEKREDYEALLDRGIDALYDGRYELAIGLRREIQREKFGKNDDVGNHTFYNYCLHHFPHVCENCGHPIANPWATNVSHILTRGAHPEMAHDPRNVNILCWACHEKWEHTTSRHRLNPWFVEKNERTITKLKQEYAELDTK
jgi:5-methylcytosine-specific restriction endonuclease McrA